MRPPRTIKAALLTGFLVILAVWLASTAHFTRRLTETQARSAAIHARYARGQELLFAVRSQVLLGSVYVRDALIEIDQAFTEAAVARDQLRRLQAQVSEELEQYQAIDAVDDDAGWTKLDAELRDYWDAAVRLVALEADRVFVQRLAASVVVTVEDDGVGLQPPGTGNRVRRDGLGLVGIRERVADLGATFRIEGNSGKGTRLTIELPLALRA